MEAVTIILIILGIFTRTDDPSEEGLITLSFSSKYNLFGQKTAFNIGHHIPYTTPFYNNGVLSESDYVKKEYSSKFTYPQKPFYKSFKKE